MRKHSLIRAQFGFHGEFSEYSLLLIEQIEQIPSYGLEISKDRVRLWKLLGKELRRIVREGRKV